MHNLLLLQELCYDIFSVYVRNVSKTANIQLLYVTYYLVTGVGRMVLYPLSFIGSTIFCLKKCKNTYKMCKNKKNIKTCKRDYKKYIFVKKFVKVTGVMF